MTAPSSFWGEMIFLIASPQHHEISRQCDKNVILKTVSFALLHVFQSLPSNGHDMNKRTAQINIQPKAEKIMGF
jgi:hypothetical protein